MQKNFDDIDTRVRAAKLYDCYGSLLKENAGRLFAEYFEDDMSLSEIAESSGITRQGVYDSLKRSFVQLEDIEKKLSLIDKEEKAADIIDKLSIYSDAPEYVSLLDNLRELL